MSTYEQNKKRAAAGFCRACKAPRIDATFCQKHREAYRLWKKERTALYGKSNKTCEMCAEQAEYGVFTPTPTHPRSSNWIGRVANNAVYYCATHASVVETRVPTGSMRKLT